MIVSHGRNCRTLSLAPDAPRSCRPMQPERENIVFRGLLADSGSMRVGNGRGTPRDPGRAKFLIATQQVTAADSANSGPHS
jgi:hypothetical protein